MSWEESISSSNYCSHESNQEEKRKNEKDNFPNISLCYNETFFYVNLGFFYFFAVEEFKIRESETDRESEEPCEEPDGYDERNGSYNEIGESESHGGEDTYSDHQDEKYDYRGEEIERYPSEDADVGADMLPRKVEVLWVGEFLVCEIGFVDILHEEITVTVGTDEDGYNRGDEEDGYGERNEMLCDEVGHIGLNDEWAVDGDVLIDEDAEKGDREDESYDVCIEE